MGLVQFFFEPDSEVVGLAATMRSPASLAMEIMKSWISLRLRSAILSNCVGEGSEGKEGGIGGLRLKMRWTPSLRRSVQCFLFTYS